MKRSFYVFVLGVLIAGALILHMVSYTVQFDQWAVLVHLGKVSEEPVEPGLHWRWPWPVERVITYDRRLQHFEDVYEPAQLNDGKTILSSVYVCWRITDPVTYKRVLGEDMADGRERLRRIVGSVKIGVLGQHLMSDLVGLDHDTVLAEIEGEILDRVSQEVSPDNYGIEVVSIGFKRLGLPEETSREVLSNMRAERERLAQQYQSRGISEARRIASEANSLADQIITFATGKATDIEQEGETRATMYLALYRGDEGFASFLWEMDFLREVLADQSQFILSGSGSMWDHPSFGYFRQPPTAESVTGSDQAQP